jgi:murein DD-endopeptidase MepM/ murein hydrolase activator NlpD
MVTLLTLLVALASLSYFGAAAYLILRDDILGALAARQRYEYEDRVAALRSQVDRLGTENILQHRDVREKVGELLEKQYLIAQRQERLEPLLARHSGPPAVTNSLPLPTPRPDFGQIVTSVPSEGVSGPSAYAPEPRSDFQWPLREGQPVIKAREPDDSGPALPDKPATLGLSLEDMERIQLSQLETLTAGAYVTALTIEEALELAGVVEKDTLNIGGPFIEVPDHAGFDIRMQELDEALGRLDELREIVRRVPIINPLPGAKITSRFGSRKDPILKRMAYHSGLDFRAKKGDLIRATGAGRVTKAGWYGGYGRMVEIDHGRGISTRYAHLHEILVKKGDVVPTAAAIAKAGNSGRSTGPHLHYEIRRHGKALNPLKFITAGRQIAQLL